MEMRRWFSKPIHA